MSDREYLNERWAGHRREHDLELRAMVIAASDLDRRLDAMNELRSQIEAERGMFVTASIYDAKHEVLVQRIQLLENAQAGLSGRLSIYAAAAGLVGSVMITLLAHLVKF